MLKRNVLLLILLLFNWSAIIYTEDKKDKDEDKDFKRPPGVQRQGVCSFPYLSKKRLYFSSRNAFA